MALGGVLGVEIFPGGEGVARGFEEREFVGAVAKFFRGGISALLGFGFYGDFA